MTRFDLCVGAWRLARRIHHGSVAVKGALVEIVDLALTVVIGAIALPLCLPIYVAAWCVDPKGAWLLLQVSEEIARLDMSQRQTSARMTGTGRQDANKGARL